MVTKRDKETDFAERVKNDERSSADQYREEWAERAKREAKYEGEIDPASTVISPHTKPEIESETKIIGAHAGDPRSISPLAVDTPTEGTETPWRDTPPTNVSSDFETANDHSPPHDPNTDPDDLDSMHEDLVPPEADAEMFVEKRSAVEVFPSDRGPGSAKTVPSPEVKTKKAKAS